MTDAWEAQRCSKLRKMWRMFTQVFTQSFTKTGKWGNGWGNKDEKKTAMGKR